MKIINRYYDDASLYTIDFLEKYVDRIPSTTCKFILRYSIVKGRMKELAFEIVSLIIIHYVNKRGKIVLLKLPVAINVEKYFSTLYKYQLNQNYNIENEAIFSYFVLTK